eukprot:1160653-Pelagomonas_calceolata.AAC.14
MHTRTHTHTETHTWIQPVDAPKRPPPLAGAGVPNREGVAPNAGAEVLDGCWEPNAGADEPKEKGAGEEPGACSRRKRSKNLLLTFKH